MNNKIIAVAAGLIAVFLLGFVPQAMKASRLNSELSEARSALAAADLRDLAALAYLQSNQKNFGLAAATAGRFFNRVPEVAGQTQDESRRKAIADLLAPRDQITAELAKAAPSAIGDLQDLLLKTRAATGAGA